MNTCQDPIVDDLTIALGVLELVEAESDLSDDLCPVVEVALSRLGKASERLGVFLTATGPGSLEGLDQLG